MREAFLVLVFAAVAMSGLASGDPVSPDDLMVLADCAAVGPDAGPASTALVDVACPAAIRPGAASNMCTLNFVVTDGTELYIGAAGHCASMNGRLRVAGVPGEVGTVVHRRSALTGGDWAFIRIDPEDRVHVDPTMCWFAGPTKGPTGLAVRAPIAGESVLHYGHGASFGSMQETKGRVGVTVANLFGGHTFTFAGSVDVGDSGSPVRIGTGEAAGIAIATVVPGYAPNLVVASRFGSALDSLSAALGKPVSLVEGDAPLAV